MQKNTKSTGNYFQGHQPIWYVEGRLKNTIEVFDKSTDGVLAVSLIVSQYTVGYHAEETLKLYVRYTL